jgi:hypothetical protein
MCNGTGYVGQIIISEVLIVDEEARGFLAKGDLKSAYNSSRMKHKLPGMQESALLRVRDGTTSLEEAIRILTPAAKPVAQPATASPTAGAAKPSTASPTTGAAKPAPPTNKPKASS